MNKQVVRLTTSAWSHSGVLNIHRRLTTLRRKSSGFQILDEDCAQIGADEVVANIVNLNQCKDGIYQVVTCNEWTDWETGLIDGYDYKLIPAE